EQRLSELLHQFTPEPPNAISPDAVAARVRDPAAPRRLGWRGWLPAAAAAAVVAMAAVSIGLVLVSRADHQSPSTIGQGPRPTPSASASTGVAPGQCSTARLKASVID